MLKKKKPGRQKEFCNLNDQIWRYLNTQESPRSDDATCNIIAYESSVIGQVTTSVFCLVHSIFFGSGAVADKHTVPWFKIRLQLFGRLEI